MADIAKVWPDLRDHAKRIKEHALAHLDQYLVQLEASVQKLGGHVHWAATAEDARRIVVEIAQKANCKHAVKSKSMTSEEIHLNPALEKVGIEVTETDFGEYIIQAFAGLLSTGPAYFVQWAFMVGLSTIIWACTRNSMVSRSC